MGRSKIAMKKQEDKVKRYITFSKRRVGLFNKASELCMLSGAKIAILLASPSENPKIYSFGHPSPDSVIDAYLTNSYPITKDCESNGNSLVPLHRELRTTERKAREEKAQRKEKKVMGDEAWWASDEYKEWKSVEKIEEYMNAIQKLRDNVLNRLKEVSLLNTTTTSTSEHKEDQFTSVNTNLCL